MTNREYLNKKKEVFYKKIDDIFMKYHIVLYVILILTTILLFVLAIKITPVFLALGIPALIVSMGVTIAELELWLDKEHKE